MNIFKIIVLCLMCWLAFDLMANLVVEVWWFDEVGFLSEFWIRWFVQVVLWGIGFFGSVCFSWFHLSKADRIMGSNLVGGDSQPSGVFSLGLVWLLLVVLGLGMVIGGMVYYYVGVVIDIFKFDGGFLKSVYLTGMRELFILITPLVLLINPSLILRGMAILLSVIMSFMIAENWLVVLPFFYRTDFGKVDPIFNLDLGFFIFNLPVWELLVGWLLGLVGYTVVAVVLQYLLLGNSLSEGRFGGFSLLQLKHLFSLLGCFCLVLAFYYAIARYQLLYSALGVVYGAGFTNVMVELPMEMVLIVVLCSLAVILFKQSFWSNGFEKRLLKKFGKQILGIFLLIELGSWLVPMVVQLLMVSPNEFLLEKKYIQYSIEGTRAAFNLDQIEVREFNPNNELTINDIKRNSATIDNIRLWDTNPILETNRQLQRIRLYYDFPDADIDRYGFNGLGDGDDDKEVRQVIIASRELDYNAVPKKAQTWVNKHLVYTHGYGFTMSPVNRVTESGLPYYLVKDIGTGVGGDLWTANGVVKDSIPIYKPQIYYGTLTDNYVMTSTKLQELDYPKGDENVYNTYRGKGGIKIGSMMSRWLFAEYFKDWFMLLTDNFTGDTRLLFRRQIMERIRAIAPFLRYDRDPYLVVADVNCDSVGSRLCVDSAVAKNSLYWIVDAYTVSDRYPYSDPYNQEFNYVRNSVKVVIDALNGGVEFYVTDVSDPVIQTWGKIFPKFFKPVQKMPVNLREHIRYPVDLFKIQADRLQIYHMTDGQVFYNREDQWEIPNETYRKQSQTMLPYYVNMRLPQEGRNEFITMLPFTPTERQNLISWLAARSDGKQYGRLLLYRFPKQELVYGTEQIEALIQQDPSISEQISLWNREGSKVLDGHLLVIPVESSLLYIKPLYLVADQLNLPSLARVIMAYSNKVVMKETLEEAIQSLFGSV